MLERMKRAVSYLSSEAVAVVLPNFTTTRLVQVLRRAK